MGGVCLYFKENLPIKRCKDLEILQETVISEISLGRKKVFFIVTYRSPDQTKDEFDIFYEKLQDTLDSIKDEKPHCIILTGDLNCRSKQWWLGDINSTEGMASDALLESNDLTQMIDQPTNIESTGVSYADLISQIYLLIMEFTLHLITSAITRLFTVRSMCLCRRPHLIKGKFGIIPKLIKRKYGIHY